MVVGPWNDAVDVVGAEQDMAHKRRACRAQPVEHRARQAGVVAQDYDKGALFGNRRLASPEPGQVGRKLTRGASIAIHVGCSAAPTAVFFLSLKRQRPTTWLAGLFRASAAAACRRW